MNFKLRSVMGSKKQVSNKVIQQNEIVINNDNEFVLYFYEDFSQDSVREATRLLRLFNGGVVELMDVNEKLAKLGEPEQPLPTLRIVISSVGGSMYDLLAITNEIMALKDLDVVVITEANGYAMSCGFLLYMLGDIRTVTSDFCTELLYHEVQMHGIVHENGNLLKKEIERANDVILRKYKDIIVKETLVTEEMLEEYREKDWIMDIEEARKLRIVNDKYLYEKAMSVLQDLSEDDEKVEEEKEAKPSKEEIEEVKELEKKKDEKVEKEVEEIEKVESSDNNDIEDIIKRAIKKNR
jgi:ATP-dependent protease ClpP protease subunit